MAFHPWCPTCSKNPSTGRSAATTKATAATGSTLGRRPARPARASWSAMARSEFKAVLQLARPKGPSGN